MEEQNTNTDKAEQVEAGQVEQVETEQVKTEQVETGQVNAEQADSAQTEVVSSEATAESAPAQSDPAKSETVQSDTAKSDAVEDTESTKVEATEPEKVKAEKPAKQEAKELTDESSDAESSEIEKPEIGAGGLQKLSEAKQKLPWFVVNVYSGYEQKVKIALSDRIRNAKAEDRFGHIVVPEESVTEMVKGEKKTSKKKFFPGYIMVQCDLSEHAWHLVTGTPKVSGFVGDSVNPAPLSPEEVETLLQQIEGKGPKARSTVEFAQGDAIKVVDGPFADFNGTVDDVKPDKGKLRVLISIFGRNTPVELDFVQVEKV